MLTDSKFRKLFLDIDEAKYRALPYISYSAMSSFDKDGPKSIIQKREDDIDAFAFGSCVDELLLEQDNNFEDKFYLFNGEAPTASTLELAKGILKQSNPIGREDTERVLEVLKRLKLWSKSKNDEVLKKKFDNDNFWEYIEAKQAEASGKFLIDTKMWARANTKVNILRTHKFSRDYFGDTSIPGSFTQLKGLVELYGKQFKFMLDLVTVDHEKKTITPIDLKTSSSLAKDFQGSFYKYRYWIQGGMYRKALIEIIRGTEFEDYYVNEFIFIMVNSWAENIPIRYRMPLELEEKFSNPWVDVFGTTRQGYEELISDLTWHRVNREYECTREMIENNGELVLT